jgi:CrcB protein
MTMPARLLFDSDPSPLLAIDGPPLTWGRGRDGPAPEIESATFRKTACSSDRNKPPCAAYARPMPLILIGIGGFAGAISRYLVDGLVTDRTTGAFPWGTLVVNATGSFVLGLLFAATTERAIFPPDIRGPVMIGFIGAYTTFSTYVLESWGLVESGSYGAAIANLGGSVVVGLIAVAAGLAVGRAV